MTNQFNPIIYIMGYTSFNYFASIFILVFVVATAFMKKYQILGILGNVYPSFVGLTRFAVIYTGREHQYSSLSFDPWAVTLVLFSCPILLAILVFLFLIRHNLNPLFLRVVASAVGISAAIFFFVTCIGWFDKIPLEVLEGV